MTRPIDPRLIFSIFLLLISGIAFTLTLKSFLSSTSYQQGAAISLAVSTTSLSIGDRVMTVSNAEVKKNPNTSVVAGIQPKGSQGTVLGIYGTRGGKNIYLNINYDNRVDGWTLSTQLIKYTEPQAVFTPAGEFPISLNTTVKLKNRIINKSTGKTVVPAGTVGTTIAGPIRHDGWDPSVPYYLWGVDFGNTTNLFLYETCFYGVTRCYEIGEYIHTYDELTDTETTAFEIPEWNLDPVSLVTITKTGQGLITSSPAGISCDSQCSAYFGKNIPVTLMAVPHPDFTFTNWSGGCTGGGGCSFTPTTPITVNATFTAIPQDTTPPTITITSPTNNSTVNTPTITVTGTASDPSGVSSVTVNGINAQTTNNYANWSANITLTQGVNTITVIARDSRGNTANSSVLVTYTPPVAGSFLWTKDIGGASTDLVNTVTTDLSGNIILGGGNRGIPSLPYLVKRSSSGDAIWELQFGGGVGAIQSVVTDSNSNIYVSGSFYAGEDFGNGCSVTSAGGYDIFLAKFSPAGLCQWAKRFGSNKINDDSTSEVGNSLVLDQNANIVMIGVFDSSINFGGSTFTAGTSEKDMFLAKFSTDGNHIWSLAVGGSNITSGNDVAVDSSGNIFITGSMRSPVNFGLETVPNIGLSDLFVAKYSSAGTNLWSRNFGSASPVITSSSGSRLAVSGNNLVVAGWSSNSMSFGGSNVPNNGLKDIVIAKYSTTNGAHLYSNSFGGSADDIGNDVAIDPATGKIALTGTTRSSINFGNGTVTAGPGNNAFTVNFSPELITLWANIFASGYGDGRTITLSSSGDPIVAGHFNLTATFGHTTITTMGLRDIFLSKFAK